MKARYFAYLFRGSLHVTPYRDAEQFTRTITRPGVTESVGPFHADGFREAREHAQSKLGHLEVPITYDDLFRGYYRADK